MKPDQTIFDYLEKLGFDPNTVSYLFCNNFVIAEYNPLYSENIYYKDKFELQFFFYKKDNPKILDQYYLEKWNENKLNFLIAINENKTFILDIKQKPSQENTTSLNLDSFNYGTNSKDFEAKKLEPLLKENIDNSYFWDYVIKRRKTVTEVDDDLLSNLVALHKNLTEGNNNYEEINLLILQCLFVKYLEERNIFDEEQILKKALQHNNDKELKNVFEKIKSINGDIFSNIKFTVSSKQLKELYIFFKHDYLEFKEKKQPSIIFPYKFDKIPIELISNVYEEFLGKTDKNKKESQGIFYTRSFVVDFMLSHSVYEQVNSNKKITILDPACGSGIFLVQSYKAILKQNLDLSIDDKIAILQSQIFGIDIDGRALQIAAFSLYLALLASCTENEIKDRIEKQKPMLPNLIGINLLNKNTITDNITFFVGNNTIQSFDCIVGNPPWGQIEEAVFPLENSLELLREHNIPDSIIDKMCNVAIKTDKFSQNLKKILDSEERKYINKIVKYSDIETDERVKERRSINKSNGLYSNVSHYQKSQCFLLRIDQWCNENTAISFIVNNSNFLNNESQKFRKELIQKYNILNYYDLSNISDILFKHTKEPCSVIIMDKLKSVENVFTYHTAQLTEIAKILRLIHFSSHDMKKIKQSDLLIEGQDIIWKIFVNGNWDDYQLTKKYELSKSKAFTLVCQRGFQLQKNEKNKPYKLVPLKLSDYDQYYINYPDFEKFDWKRVFFRLPLPKSFSSIFFKDNILSNFNNKDKDFILKYYRYSKKHNKYRVHKTSPSEKLKINNLLASVNSSLFTGDKILISRTPLNTKKMKCVFTSKKIPFEDNTLCLKCNWIKDYRLLLAILNSSFIGYYLHFSSTEWVNGGGRTRLRTGEIENLPLPQFDSDNNIIKKLIILVNKIQNAKKENLSTKKIEDKIDEIVFDLYGLLDFEKEIIREFYDVNVHRKRKRAKESKPVDLQKYVDKFRDVFSFILDDGLALNAEYSFQNIGAAVSFSIVKKEDFKPKFAEANSKILGIVEKKQLGKSLLSKAIKEEKIKIYNKENFTIVKSKYFKDWTMRQAMKDANEEIGLIIKKLPNE